MHRFLTIAALTLALGTVPPAPPAAAHGPPAPDTAAAGAAGAARRAARSHRVLPGECLSLIASRYGVSVAALAAANGIANPDFVRAGRVLRIPGPAAAPDEATAAAPDEATAAAPAVPALAMAAAPAGLHVYVAAAPEPPSAPARPPAHLARRAPLVAVEGVGEPVVALSFNGGPPPELLPALLTALERYRFRATFFVEPAWTDRHPEAVRQIQSHGHELGAYGLPAGAWPHAAWIRSPGGAWQPGELAAARRQGLVPALWSSIGLRDYPGTPAGVLARQAADSLFPGAVLMLHGDRLPTVTALPDVLGAIRRAGYTAVSLSELAVRSEPPPAGIH